MNCYYHPLQPAVGVCRSCLRGVCAACAVDLDRGLACRNRCESDVRNLLTDLDESRRLNAISAKLIRGSQRSGILLNGFFIFLGGVFCYWGWTTHTTPVAVVGAGFALVGLIRWFLGPKARK